MVRLQSRLAVNVLLLLCHVQYAVGECLCDDWSETCINLVHNKASTLLLPLATLQAASVGQQEPDAALTLGILESDANRQLLDLFTVGSSTILVALHYCQRSAIAAWTEHGVTATKLRFQNTAHCDKESS